jgi:putative phage-type endonuclease
MTAQIIQGSEAWFAARLGRVTASRLADVIAKTKSGESASRGNYRAELVAERLTGKRAEGFSNAAMAWGTAAEPLARAAYEAETGVFVTETGMVDHPAIAMSGASPDGLVGTDGQIEAKCPETKNHIDTILSGKAPAKYIPQMQWQMACTGRAWCDFISFDPRMPADMQLFVVRVMRDDELISTYEAEVVKFLAEVDDTIVKLAQWQQAA